jgi:hypothetical protein
MACNDIDTNLNIKDYIYVLISYTEIKQAKMQL